MRFDFGVVRTFRSAVSGRPEGLHDIGVENAVGIRRKRPFGWQRRRSSGWLFAGPPSTAEREIRARAETRIRFVHDCQIELSGFQIRRLWFRQGHRSVDAR